MTAGMYLTARFGVVHKVTAGDPGCTTVALARIRRAVTPNQCLVYGLCGCDNCWPGRDEFARIVGLKRQGLRP
jgi:hypothetical protein